MAMSTGKVVALIQAMGGGADPAVIEAKVQDWLDAHPEATTTVQDGSITEQKLATSIAQKLGLISSLSDEIADINANLFVEKTITENTVEITPPPVEIKNIISEIDIKRQNDSTPSIATPNRFVFFDDISVNVDDTETVVNVSTAVNGQKYAGTYDWKTGTLTIDYICQTMKSADKTMGGYYNTYILYRIRLDNEFIADSSLFKCSHGSSAANYQQGYVKLSCGSGGGNNNWVGLQYPITTETDTAEADAVLDAMDMQVFYPLATPIIINNFTPQIFQPDSTKTNCIISSNTGASRVTYVSDKNRGPVEIRIGTINIGHFDEAEKAEYRSVFAKMCCNIIGIAENKYTGTESQHDEYNDFYGMFRYYASGERYTLNCNAFVSDYYLHDTTETAYTNRSQPRYMYEADIYVQGKPVHLIATHLDFNSSITRRAQITQLINKAKTYDRCIITGDFNIYPDSGSTSTEEEMYTAEYKMFTDEGFRVANAGYFGAVNTDLTKTDLHPIDNIIVSSNIMIKNLMVITESWMHDHAPVYCDIVIY